MSTAAVDSPSSAPEELTQEKAKRRNKKHFFDPSTNTGDEETSGSALLNLALYSFLLFTLPIAVFFFVKQLLEDWAYSEIYVMVMPAIAAVATVNVIIILYVISAFRQERRSFKTD